MSKKDYVAIARAICTATYAADDMADRFTAARIAREIANALAADNPRFDRERFIRACEYERKP